MKNTICIKKRTFDARYATNKADRDRLNGDIMTSQFGFQDQYAVLINNKPFALFKTLDDAKDFISASSDIIVNDPRII